MWQFWLAAAVAGSGLLAKQLFSHGGRKGSLRSEEEQEVPVHSANPDGRIGDFKGTQLKNLEIEEEGIFRFSSLGGSDRSGGWKSSLKQKKKKKKKKKARLEGYGDGGVSDIEQKLGALYLEKMVVKDERKKGRRFCVGLKRRKTGKSALVKCGSSCSSLGFNIALMYMVSTGKAEINKLSAAVDETTKVINDLRSKLNKRKISFEVSYKSRDNECLKETICKDKQHSVTRLPPLGANKDDSDVLGHQSTEEGECASTSSVVTDEPESEMPEMDKLEAELELELQKISCCTSEEPSALKGNKSTSSTLEQKYIRDVGSAGGPSDFRDQVGADCKSSLFHGVSPSELDRKLCHLLIEQQENQILELDSRIKLTDAKFHQKEAELEALKDCVRHLKDFSLEIASDEEAEEETTNVEQERNNDFGLLMSTRSLVDDLEKEVHSGQKVVVGMKRTMDCAPYDCK